MRCPTQEIALEPEDDDGEGVADGDLSSIQPRVMEQCKLVRIVSDQKFFIDVVQHTGIGCADGSEDDPRKGCGTVRDCLICTDIVLSYSGVGMSYILVKDRYVGPIILQSRDLGMLQGAHENKPKGMFFPCNWSKTHYRAY